MKKLIISFLLIVFAINLFGQNDSIINLDLNFNPFYTKVRNYDVPIIKGLSRTIKIIKHDNLEPYGVYKIGDCTELTCSDILNILKAIDVLKTKVDKDIEAKPDLITNAYYYSPDVSIRYSVRMNKITNKWFVTWTLRYGNRGYYSFDINDINSFELSLNQIIDKINDILNKKEPL